MKKGKPFLLGELSNKEGRERGPKGGTTLIKEDDLKRCWNVTHTNFRIGRGEKIKKPQQPPQQTQHTIKQTN